MKSFLIATLLVGVLAAPAFAFHCPVDMAKIDRALAAGTDLSAVRLGEVKTLRAEGERLHNAGDHQKAVDTLAEAMRLLGIE